MKRLLLATALVSLLTAPASAMLIELPLGKLTADAADIVRGTVVEQNSAWTADGTTIYTDVTLRVNDPWKGSFAKGSIITVRIRGGEVGPIGIRVEHEPRFYSDEEVLVFLEPSTNGPRRVFAAEQGKYTVIEDRHIVNTLHEPVLLKDFRADVVRYLPQEDHR